MLFNKLLPAAALLALPSILASKPPEKRQDTSDFTAQAMQLISDSLPPSVLSALDEPVASAAATASVTGTDENAIVYSALLATSVPDWFDDAIPERYTSQIAQLERQISGLRGQYSATNVPNPTGSGTAISVPIESMSVGTIASSSSGYTLTFAVPITTTDQAGSTYVSETVVTAVSFVPTTTRTGEGVMPLVTATDSMGRTYTSSEALSTVTALTALTGTATVVSAAPTATSDSAASMGRDLRLEALFGAGLFGLVAAMLGL